MAKALFLFIALIGFVALIEPPTAFGASEVEIGEAYVCVIQTVLRKGPGVRHEELARISDRPIVPVYSVFERNWLKIKYRGQVGWIHRTMAITVGLSAKLNTNPATSCRGHELPKMS